MRRKVFIVAGCLAVCAAILPLVAAVQVSRMRATEAELRHLSEYASWTALRADANLGQGRKLLEEIEKENWAECSPEHIGRMRQLAVASPYIAEVGYFQNDLLACTSWGVVMQRIPFGTVDATLPDGFGLHVGHDALVTKAGPMLALSKGSHNVLIRPQQLVDVLRDTHMTLGIATENGKLIAMSGEADPELVSRLLAHPGSGMDDHHLYASETSRGLTVFAMSERSAIQQRLDSELWTLVPVGLLASGALLALVLWMSRQRLSTRGELAIAIKKREFVAHYQPIIELSTGLCVGGEALVRWQKPDGSMVPPNVFIPMAEQVGLIARITDLVIERVAQDLARTLAQEPGMHVSINISSSDIESGRFLPVLARTLHRYGINPEQIWLEATERGFMHAKAARKTIESARAAGHVVAIDDFGTGYSSLSMLEQLPLDTLKIDKTFVDAIGKEAATSVVTPYIIEMAQGLRLRIVAEGVETVEQEAYLRGAGVDYAQGWLYAKALAPKEFIDFYDRRNSGERASD